jgi:DNA-binding Xre family transcriptional regulator
LIKIKIFEMMARLGCSIREALAQASGPAPVNLGKIVRGTVRRIELATPGSLNRARGCQPGDLLEYVEEGSPAP